MSTRRGTLPFREVKCRSYHWLGHDATAYEWLERGFVTREVWMTWLHPDPRLRRMRGDVRFEAMVRRVEIAPERPLA